MRRDALMSLLRRGRCRGVDAQRREGGVVHLAGAAHQQHQCMWWRFRQHLAHALRRAACLCDPGHHDIAVGVVSPVVVAAAVQHGLAYGADDKAIEAVGGERALQQADDEALVLVEGVQGHHDGLAPVGQLFRRCGKGGADDAHAGFRSVDWSAMGGRDVAVWPEVRDAA